MLIEDGRVVRFVTAMTGELFAVLGQHSLLKSDAPADDDAAFDEGLAAAGAGDALAARLFSARARVVGGQAEPASTPSYLSGLLIGAEVAAPAALAGRARPRRSPCWAMPALCARYAPRPQPGWASRPKSSTARRPPSPGCGRFPLGDHRSGCVT